jgi:hypothetical protein
LKKHGLVADADEKRAANFKNQYQKVGGAQGERDPKKLPTISKKVTTDLGISEPTFRRHIERAKTVAQKAGLLSRA